MTGNGSSDAQTPPLTGAVRSGDADQVRALLAAGADVAARDGNDWSALDWAAGQGDLEMIEQLLGAGADATATAQDGRRPYDIAVAAGHRGAALALRDAIGRASQDDTADYRWRPYCRAYPLAELRRYPDWPVGTAQPEPGAGEEPSGQQDQIVFLHDDLTVTASMWPGEDVIFDAVTAEWAQFCTAELGFAVPDEIDLIPAERPAAASG
jgi:hypothetical protein